MRRYVRSFIGLMEENKDGTWCKLSEVEKLSEKLTSVINRMIKSLGNSYKKVRYIKNHYLLRVISLFTLLTLSLLLNLFLLS